MVISPPLTATVRLYCLSRYKNTKLFLDKFYEHSHVTHILHGVKLDKFKIDVVDKKQADMLKFIYVGNLDDVHKGFNILIRGIRLFLEQNKGIKVFFEFCGVGPLKFELKNKPSVMEHGPGFYIHIKTWSGLHFSLGAYGRPGKAGKAACLENTLNI